MIENEFPFLNELRTELRRVAHEQAGNSVRRWRPTRTWGLASVPALVVIGVIAYVVLTAGSAVTARVPVISFSGQATAAAVAPTTSGSKVVGDAA